jgi:hypothetical protein
VGDDVVEVKEDSGSGPQATRLWLEPGTVSVVARSDDGREVTKEASITARGNATVTLQFPDLAEAPNDVPADSEPLVPEESDGSPFPAPPLPSYIALGVGAVGFGLFAAFGAMSASTASDLDACAPRCPTTMREDADSGSTNQTVANVGLIVGVTGVAAAAGIWLVVALTDDPSEEAQAVRLRIGPTGLGLSATF